MAHFSFDDIQIVNNVIETEDYSTMRNKLYTAFNLDRNDDIQKIVRYNSVMVALGLLLETENDNAYQIISEFIQQFEKELGEQIVTSVQARMPHCFHINKHQQQ